MQSASANHNKVLHLLTAQFPYGSGESVIEVELPFLAEVFDHIRIWPYHNPKPNSKGRQLEVPLQISSPFKGLFRPRKMDVLRYAGLFLPILWQEFRVASDKKYFLSKLPIWLGALSLALQEGAFLLSNLQDKDQAIFYSFWMNQWGLTLALLKKQGKIDGFQFNCGGFDIWDERHPGNYLPFRRFIYSQATRLTPNTKTGAAYIKAKKLFPEKVQPRYYGTIDHGLNPFDQHAPFTLISISNIIPLKRIHLIIEILSEVQTPMRWIHFGQGPLLASLQEKAAQLPSHIKVEWRGQVPNTAIHAFFQAEPVNLFVSVSETEGLPVSIMEAMSYGIPTMATAVGGVPEEVVPETGILLDADFAPLSAARQLDDFAGSINNSPAYRAGVRAYWETHFNAAVNHRRFASSLLLDLDPADPALIPSTTPSI